MSPSRKASVPSTQPGGVHRFGRRILDDTAHDPYRADAKLPLGATCTQCGARFIHGHWAWIKGSKDAAQGAGVSGTAATHQPTSHPTLCPACRRVRDHQPAGFLTLVGPTVERHRAEVLALIRHEAARAMAEHPLQRIIDIVETPERIDITTTDLHVPRRIGQALRAAHHGHLQMTYGQDDISVRVQWAG